MDSVEQNNWIKTGMQAFPSTKTPLSHGAITAFVIPTEGMYQSGYQRAADLVVSGAGLDDLNADDLFFPVTYLYRHHLELALKGLVCLGVDMGLLHGCDAMLADHGLEPLWDKAREMIRRASPESPQADLDAVGTVIHQFHCLDPDGQRLRYSRNLTGKQNPVSVPHRVDLANLKSVVEAVSNYLDAAYAAIDACR